MVEKYFVWKFEEYEWCGRTEYKKVVVILNASRRSALDICAKDHELRMNTMDKLDDTYEK